MSKNGTREGLVAFLRAKAVLDDKAEKGPFGYHEEYATLRQSTLKYRDDSSYAATEGEKQYNYRKNRYKDILPYDYTRVELKRINDMPGTDYINANYIKSDLDHITYIAAQGPLPNTVKDFWRLIWEQNVKVILMACSEYEGDPPKHKCERYWPDSTDEVMKYDNITVSLERDIPSTFSDYKIRYLRVECNNEVHKIHHLHYVGWPDHGVPTSVTAIIDMIAQGRNYQPEPEAPPFVIHCSAGCGRTGTIIAIEIAWNMLKNGKINTNFSLFSVIDEIRKQRPSLVQSLEQYKFVYEAVAEIFERHLDIMTKHAYENVSLMPPCDASSKETSEKRKVGDHMSQSVVAVESPEPAKNSSIYSSSTNRMIQQTANSLNKRSSGHRNEAVTASPNKTAICRTTSNDNAKPSAPPKPRRFNSGAGNDDNTQSTPAESPKITSIKANFESRIDHVSGDTNARVERKSSGPIPAERSAAKAPSSRSSYEMSDKAAKVTASDKDADTRGATYSLASAQESAAVTMTISDVCSGESVEWDEDTEETEDYGGSETGETDDHGDPYAYANPYQEDKWSLQHIAIGKTAVGGELDGAYSEVAVKVTSEDSAEQQITLHERLARSKSRNKQTSAPKYEEVNEPAPLIPKEPAHRKSHESTHQISRSKQPDVVTDCVTYSQAGDVDSWDGGGYAEPEAEEMSDEEPPEIPQKMANLTSPDAVSSGSGHGMSGVSATMGRKIEGFFSKIRNQPKLSTGNYDNFGTKTTHENIGFPHRVGKPQGPRKPPNAWPVM